MNRIILMTLALTLPMAAFAADDSGQWDGGQDSRHSYVEQHEGDGEKKYDRSAYHRSHHWKSKGEHHAYDQSDESKGNDDEYDVTKASHEDEESDYAKDDNYAKDDSMDYDKPSDYGDDSENKDDESKDDESYGYDDESYGVGGDQHAKDEDENKHESDCKTDNAMTGSTDDSSKDYVDDTYASQEVESDKTEEYSEDDNSVTYTEDYDDEPSDYQDVGSENETVSYSDAEVK